MRVSHIEHHIEQQTASMELIANSLSRLMNVGASNITAARIETRRTALEEIWSTFQLKHNQITLSVKNLRSDDKRRIMDNPYFKDKLFQAAHEGYLETLESMNALLERTQRARDRSPSAQSGSRVSSCPTGFNNGPRLPYVNLPTFNGTPSEWLPFKDMFESLVISNANVTSVWKLHYLKQSLKGTAAHLLKNTTLTSDNFQKAWNSLVAFYENKRLLVNSALQSLMSMRRMTKESAAEMEVLYTTVTQIYRSLETLGRPVDKWDDIFVFVTTQRLDSESVKSWEQHLGSSKEPPTWCIFTEFLMTRLLTLQAVEKSRRPAHHTNQHSFHSHHTAAEHSNSRRSSCAICSGDHYTTRCPKYADKTTQQRVEIVRKKQLCYNCLGKHQVSTCFSTRRCSKCGKKHHSTIHEGRASHQRETLVPASTSGLE